MKQLNDSFKKNTTIVNPDVNRKIKVLIVDDSLVSQKLYQGLLKNDDRFEMVGVAVNGQQAIEYVVSYQPDVVSMDINMPLMDGVEATRNIMQINPVPVLIVSSLYQTSEVEMAMKVLEVGAVNIIPKPHGPGHPRFEQEARQYLNMLKSMSEVKVVRRRDNISKAIPQQVRALTNLRLSDFRILVIGASAGGPEGVKTILTGLRQDFPLPILIVQHIHPHFAEGFGHWLQTTSNIPVQLAKTNQQILSGNAYLAPGDHHMVLTSEGISTLTNEEPVGGHRPAVAQLFKSAANIYRNKVIAILLSGMGTDGAKELKILKDHGAFTMVQNEQSCLVFGMPGEAVRLGAASKALSPQEIVHELNTMKP
ncbi:MAG: chemotaxis response regulator protein-glutamate methylesterase [Bacteroidetes bacterium HGW-Bacteroidetes-1]|nr:MAG: chemotaxis response regulator protein-glutamate methylesterase [Bacteroidetes bacterium HGW-Bacteroidetes-1]